MPLTVQPLAGEPYEFEIAKGVVSQLVCEEILAGLTYPVLPFIGDVRVVVDAGANCGAASVYFAQHYPDAVVHAVEPASEPLSHLRRNVRGLPNVVVHPLGLHSLDQEVPLFHGKGDTGLASIVQASWHRDSSEMVTIRSASTWAQEQGIDRVDVLKVDVELCEYEVLSSLAALLPSVKVVYFEYGSRQIRRSIERLLDPTHDLYLGKMSLDQGECIYLRRDLADRDGAKERLWAIFGERAKASKPME
jgi:FkbM family methyltransferase